MRKKNLLSSNGRLFFVGCITTFVGVIILAQFFFIQIVSSDYYSSLAERQQIASKELIPRRGEIFFQSKEAGLVSAATTRSGFILFMDPRKLRDPKYAYEEIDKILREASEGVTQEKVNNVAFDAKRFFELAEKKDDPFEIIVPRIETSIAEKIRKIGIDGIGVLPTEWRFYPFGNIAAHALGFVDANPNQRENRGGQYGVEQFYEENLRGHAGYAEGPISSGGIFLKFDARFFHPPSEGEDIVLTIEIEVQQELERLLDQFQERWLPRRSGGIVIDPRTGRIIAMAARPSFDGNFYSQTEDVSYFLNPLISSVFEFGSVFKPLTVAAAIDAGVITPQTTYFDKGFVNIGKERIENYDAKGRGMTDIQGILNQSLNTGAVFIAQKLGHSRFLEYFEKYGFEEKTGIDLPAETKGSLSNLKSGRDIEYATASFGQGIAVTPIEFVRAASALANGGKLIRPYIVEKVGRINEEDRRRFIARSQNMQGGGGTQILRAETSVAISRMLATVVDKALLGGGKGLKTHTVAAKTGTAQIASRSAGGYSEEFLHSFFGYAPAFDPKFLIFLFMEAPRGVTYASQTLGEPFLDLTNFLLDYYEVPPDR